MFSRDSRVMRLESKLREINPEAAKVWSIADELVPRIAARIDAAEPKDYDAALEAAITETEDHMVQRSLLELVLQLPVEELLDRYAKIIGDERVRQAIIEIAALRQQAAERQARFMAIARRAHISREFDIREAEDGEIITLGLFRGLSEASYENKLSASRIIAARAIFGTGGPLSVVSDRMGDGSTWRLSIKDNRTMADHTKFRAGRLIKDGETTTFEPVLTHGTKLAIETPYKQIKELGYRIGYVLLGETVVLNKTQQPYEILIG